MLKNDLEKSKKKTKSSEIFFITHLRKNLMSRNFFVAVIYELYLLSKNCLTKSVMHSVLIMPWHAKLQSIKAEICITFLS